MRKYIAWGVLVLALMLGLYPSFATDVFFDLTEVPGFGASPATNRQITIQQQSPFVGNVVFLPLTDSTGRTTNLNIGTGLFNCVIKAPPAAISFQIYVTATNLGTIDALTIPASGQSSTYPAGSVAWSIFASDQRYAFSGTTSSNNFYPLFSNPSNYVQLPTLVAQGTATTNYTLATSNLLYAAIGATNTQIIAYTTNYANTNAIARATAVTNGLAISSGLMAFQPTNGYTTVGYVTNLLATNPPNLSLATGTLNISAIYVTTPGSLSGFGDGLYTTNPLALTPSTNSFLSSNNVAQLIQTLVPLSSNSLVAIVIATNTANLIITTNLVAAQGLASTNYSLATSNLLNGEIVAATNGISIAAYYGVVTNDSRVLNFSTNLNAGGTIAGTNGASFGKTTKLIITSQGYAYGNLFAATNPGTAQVLELANSGLASSGTGGASGMIVDTFGNIYAISNANALDLDALGNFWSASNGTISLDANGILHGAQPLTNGLASTNFVMTATNGFATLANVAANDNITSNALMSYANAASLASTNYTLAASNNLNISISATIIATNTLNLMLTTNLVTAATNGFSPIVKSNAWQFVSQYGNASNIVLQGQLSMGTKTNWVYSTNVIGITGAGSVTANGTYVGLNGSSTWTNVVAGNMQIWLVAGNYYLISNGITLYVSPDVVNWSVYVGGGPSPAPFGTFGQYNYTDGQYFLGGFYSPSLTAQMTNAVGQYSFLFSSNSIFNLSTNSIFNLSTNYSFATNVSATAYPYTSNQLFNITTNNSFVTNVVANIPTNLYWSLSGNTAPNIVLGTLGNSTFTLIAGGVTNAFFDPSLNNVSIGRNNKFNGGSNNIAIGYGNNFVSGLGPPYYPINSTVFGISNYMGTYSSLPVGAFANTISGGYLNTNNSTMYGFIGNGTGNHMDSNPYETILNGLNNFSHGDYATILGGSGNSLGTAAYGSHYGLIGVGTNNYIGYNTYFSFIPYGSGNSIADTYSNDVAIGSEITIANNGVTAINDGVLPITSTADRQLLLAFTNGAYINGSQIMAGTYAHTPTTATSTTSITNTTATRGTWVVVMKLIEASSGYASFYVQIPGIDSNSICPPAAVASGTFTNVYNFPINPFYTNSITDTSGSGASVTVLKSYILQ